MPKRLYPTNVIKQAQDVLTGWNQIAPVPAFGTLTAATFTTDITAATTIEAQIAALEAQLTDKRTARDAQFKSLWDKTKRLRNLGQGQLWR
jgi:hypothetical protein